MEVTRENFAYYENFKSKLIYNDLEMVIKCLICKAPFKKGVKTDLFIDSASPRPETATIHPKKLYFRNLQQK
ncbi:hypothetical protein NQ317_017203 [Molorchus minor]|uniref:Uncharacterized protein n=1 Tax=Molorchus minor TaxID=1323400 RepID=A0ABQ9ISJ2_9CUCU|nr:hypothetical protein NQ317_017203 [Molorchus minor]